MWSILWASQWELCWMQFIRMCLVIAKLSRNNTWQLQLQTTLLRAVQSRVRITGAQCLHAFYVAPGTVATVRFVVTSETKELPHNDQTRLDGSLCDEPSTGYWKWHDDEMKRKLNFCTSCPMNHGWQLPGALSSYVRVLNSSGTNTKVVGRHMYLFWLCVLVVNTDSCYDKKNTNTHSPRVICLTDLPYISDCWPTMTHCTDFRGA